MYHHNGDSADNLQQLSDIGLLWLAVLVLVIVVSDIERRVCDDNGRLAAKDFLCRVHLGKAVAMDEINH